MQINESTVSQITRIYYNITPILGSIKQLPGYDDKNYVLIDAASNKSFILKIVNPKDSNNDLTGKLDFIILTEKLFVCL